MSDPAGGEDEDRAADEVRPSLQRLDPDFAAGVSRPPPGARDAPGPAPDAGGSEPAATVPPPAASGVDTRRYGWMVGIIGLALVVGISVYQFASHGVGNTGITAGHRLLDFAAPLAATNLNGNANDHPTCSAARHDPRALNVCLLARRGPLVLSFFVTGAGQCVREVSAMQTLARRFPSVQFAAVAIGASHQATARLIRAHHWRIPVAYDPDGRVGALYGVAVCPMAELADRGGVVRARLIGNRWQTVAALAPQVQRLLAGGSAPG